MPEYGIRNKITGEEWLQRMGIAEMEEFIAKNPDLETFPNGSPMIHSGRGLGGGLRKIDSGFNDILMNIKRESNRGITRSTINTK